MRRIRILLAGLCTAAVVVVAAVAGSATAAQYTGLKGYEVDPTQGIFVGLISTGNTATSQVWIATISHEGLNTKPHAVTEITGGTLRLGPGFSFDWLNGFQITGPALTITGGELVAGPSVGGKGFCTQSFAVHGALAPLYPGAGAGSFDGTLKHYGGKVHGTCSADFASVTVAVDIPGL